eukprot:753871-Hanusia_phi.AAC.7
MPLFAGHTRVESLLYDWPTLVLARQAVDHLTRPRPHLPLPSSSYHTAAACHVKPIEARRAVSA